MLSSKAKRFKLTTQLDQRHAALLDEVRDALEQSENQQYVALLDGEVGDIGDQSVGDTLADLSLAIIDRHVQEMRDIEAARERIQDGTFGNCDDCGDEIVFERLLAYPTAKRCVICQQQRERVYAHAGTPTL